jgi:hypothetical protein
VQRGGKEVGEGLVRICFTSKRRENKSTNTCVMHLRVYSKLLLT